MLSLVMDAFDSVVAKVNESNAKRIARLENAWSESNSNIPPVMDSHGRLHAPCDGYVLPEMYVDYIGNYDETLFAKGQYLPIPLTGDDYFDHKRFQKANVMNERYMPRGKIKVLESLATEIIDSLVGNMYIKFSKGASWEVNGDKVCYLYLSSPSEAVLNQFVCAVKDSIENKEIQSYSGLSIEGKQTVRGKIVNISCEDNMYTRNQYDFVYKITVHLDDDSICYGTLPKSISSAVVGDVIEFTATFEKSSKKEYMSYYKRPTKASVVENKS